MRALTICLQRHWKDILKLNKQGGECVVKPKLNYYKDKENDKEYIAIVTDPVFEDEAVNQYGMRLIASVELPADFNFVSWPTDRFLEEE